jgi:hypothetical protein
MGCGDRTGSRRPNLTIPSRLTARLPIYLSPARVRPPLRVCLQGGQLSRRRPAQRPDVPVITVKPSIIDLIRLRLTRPEYSVDDVATCDKINFSPNQENIRSTSLRGHASSAFNALLKTWKSCLTQYLSWANGNSDRPLFYLAASAI